MTGHEKGFTLIEIVIALTLFIIILGGVSAILFSGLDSWTHGEEQIDVVQNMRIGLDKMVREIREAVDITSSGDTYIQFTVPIVDDNSLDFTGSVKSMGYQYDSADQELERKVVGSTPQPVASRIKNITFSYSGTPTKIVNITMVGVSKDGQEITMESKVLLRSVSR
jgi:type II secretory pathway pseudopilin PulG